MVDFEMRCCLAGCGIRIANAAIGYAKFSWPTLAALVGAALMVLIAQLLGLLGYRIDSPENLSSSESIFVLFFLQTA